jgi:hypothetical protein
MAARLFASSRSVSANDIFFFWNLLKDSHEVHTDLTRLPKMVSLTVVRFIIWGVRQCLRRLARDAAVLASR